MTALSRIVVPHPLAKTWPYKAISFARFDLAGNPRYTVGADKEEFGATAALVDALIRFGGQCFRCGVFSAPHALSKEQALHHVRAKDGAPESLENLMIVCGRCKPAAKAAAAELPEPPKQVQDQTSEEPREVYPGEFASSEQILELARAYHASAETLLAKGPKRTSKWTAPYRLVAIHAVELYLNALLNFCGVPAPKIRGLQHNLANRAESLKTHGVVLRAGTLKHLKRLTGSREYLCARYDAEMREKPSELTRLAATLNDVASKVIARIERG